MSDWQPWGYRGKPETCMWCGRKLRRRTVTAEPNEPGATEKFSFWSKPAERLGGYQDDKFCGLRCGYQYGERVAEMDRRMVQRRAAT